MYKMAVIREREFDRITAIYEQQAEECVHSIERFYDEITELARRTAYEPLVNFTNQIYKFYKGDLREHMQREFEQWYDSDYSLHALTKNIGAGIQAEQKARYHMDQIKMYLQQMFQRGPNPIYVDVTEPEIEDRDFDIFSSAVFTCVRNCERANQDAVSKINVMAADNNAVSCITGFVKTMGVSIVDNFQKMLGQVEKGLGAFQKGVNVTVDQVPNTGHELEGHIFWEKGIRFM